MYTRIRLLIFSTAETLNWHLTALILFGKLKRHGITLPLHHLNVLVIIMVQKYRSTNFSNARHVKDTAGKVRQKHKKRRHKQALVCVAPFSCFRPVWSVTRHGTVQLRTLLRETLLLTKTLLWLTRNFRVLCWFWCVFKQARSLQSWSKIRVFFKEP